LKASLAKEGALTDAGFDRGPFDRSGFYRSTALEDIKNVEHQFEEKDMGPAR
jgi:hypothetical protein